jgi:hypothetical protein
MRQLTLVSPGRLERREVAEPRIEAPDDAFVRPIAATAYDLDQLGRESPKWWRSGAPVDELHPVAFAAAGGPLGSTTWIRTSARLGLAEPLGRA